MDKTKKVIIALFAAILMVFGVAGCSSGTNELQSKIDDLQGQLEEMSNRLTEMDEKIEQLGKDEKPMTLKNCEAEVETTLYSGVDKCKDFIAICNSLDEFKEECLRNGYDFFDNNNQENNCFNTTAGEKIHQYTDEYFEDKAFVVCAFYKSSWAGQYLIEEVKVTSKKLTLYIKYPRNDTANCVINNVFLIAGVNKSFVSDITDLEYVLR